MAYNYDYPYVDVGRQNADWLLNQIKELNSKVKELSDKVDAFDITKEEVISLIEDAISLCKSYTNDQINLYDEFKMKPYVTEMINNFNILIRQYINQQDESYYTAQSERTDSIAADLITYIDNKVINILDMINPVTGQEQTIPEVIDYIVETFHRENALTAAQYDGYELTANAYDSQLISAYAYDFDGVNQVIH